MTILHTLLPLKIFTFAALALTPLTRVQSQEAATDTEVLALSSLPFSLIERFIKSELSLHYEIGSRAVNPFYLTGDFDGDGRMDYVLRLVSKEDKDKEEDAVFFATGAPRLLSTDINEGYPGPAWYVVSKNEKINLGATDEKGAKPPKPKGDSIMMVRPESSSAARQKAIRRRHQYATILTDIGGGRVHEVAEGRTAKVAAGLLRDLPEEVRDSIEAVAIEMWPAYIRAVGDALLRQLAGKAWRPAG